MSWHAPQTNFFGVSQSYIWHPYSKLHLVHFFRMWFWHFGAMAVRPLVSHLLPSKHSLQPISNEEFTHSLATMHNLSGNIHFAAVSLLNRHRSLVNLCHRKTMQQKIKLWNLWTVRNDKHRAEEQRMWACGELMAGEKWNEERRGIAEMFSDVMEKSSRGCLRFEVYVCLGVQGQSETGAQVTRTCVSRPHSVTCTVQKYC